MYAQLLLKVNTFLLNCSIIHKFLTFIDPVSYRPSYLSSYEANIIVIDPEGLSSPQVIRIFEVKMIDSAEQQHLSLVLERAHTTKHFDQRL